MISRGVGPIGSIDSLWHARSRHPLGAAVDVLFCTWWGVGLAAELSHWSVLYCESQTSRARYLCCLFYTRQTWEELLANTASMLTFMRTIRSCLSLLGLNKFDHISRVLCDRLHWLPVEQRIQYKLCLLVYKAQCRPSLAPQYLVDFCQPVSAVSGRSGLRSSTCGDLVVVRTETDLGERSFALAAPLAWNRLPEKIRNIIIIIAVVVFYFNF